MKVLSKLLFLTTLVLIGCTIETQNLFAQLIEKQQEVLKEESLKIRTRQGEEFLFRVEIAETPYQQMQGLMNRTHLDEEAGMLFLFPDEAKRVFWMKDTLIPLDMLFLSADGTIHHIHHNAAPQDLSQITAEKSSKAVLEINGGAADQYGIHEGDQVIYSAFHNVLPNAQ